MLNQSTSQYLNEWISNFSFYYRNFMILSLSLIFNYITHNLLEELSINIRQSVGSAPRPVNVGRGR